MGLTADISLCVVKCGHEYSFTPTHYKKKTSYVHLLTDLTDSNCYNWIQIVATTL